MALAVVLVLVGVGGVAVARSTPSLRTGGPTSVTGTEATAVFTIGDRTVRQVRYDDHGILRYTFEITNDGSIPVRVVGLADRQNSPRLFHYIGLTTGTIDGGDTERFSLSMRMSGCETLSARAGSFVTAIRVRTERAGVFHDDVLLTLPEQLHTGSPREAFCPNSTATSRPPG